MGQLTLDIFAPDVAPEGYLPCSNPDLVAGYVALARLITGNSGDFGRCYECNEVLCEHHLDSKREDASYLRLVQHFEEGGALNQPICYDPEYNYLENGHHRVAAALDAGFKYIPYQRKWGKDDWTGCPLEEYGFYLDEEYGLQMAE